MLQPLQPCAPPVPSSPRVFVQPFLLPGTLLPKHSLVAHPHVSPSGKHFLSLQSRSAPVASFISPIKSLVHLLPSSQEHSSSFGAVFTIYSPSGLAKHLSASFELFVPKGHHLSPIFLCLEPNQALYLLSNDGSEMARKTFPSTSIILTRNELRGQEAGGPEAKTVWSISGPATTYLPISDVGPRL